MKNQAPFVSICIPVFNAGKYFRVMLDSVFNQTYDNFEVIISDNASTDETIEIAESFLSNKNLRIYKNSENIGGEANFNKCLSYSKGEFVALFHADDIYRNVIISEQVKAFCSNPNLGVVFSNFNIINENGRILNNNVINSKFLFDYPLTFKYFISQIIKSYGAILSTPSAMIKRSVIDSIECFNSKEFITAADLNMWLAISEKFDVLYLSQKLFSWRVSKDHGSYYSRYLRIEEADYFKVINSYIKKYGTNYFEFEDLNILSFYKYLDYQRCLLNANLTGVKIKKYSSTFKIFDLISLFGKIKFKHVLYFSVAYIINKIQIYSVFIFFKSIIQRTFNRNVI